MNRPYAETLADSAVTVALWAQACRRAGDEAGARIHEETVRRMANSIIHSREAKR